MFSLVDPDPEWKLNADPCESKSKAMAAEFLSGQQFAYSDQDPILKTVVKKY